MNHLSCPRNTPCVPLQIVRNTSLDFLIPLFWNGVPWIPHILSLYFVSELSQKSGAVSVSPDATDLCSAIRLSSFLPKQTFISSQEYIFAPPQFSKDAWAKRFTWMLTPSAFFQSQLFPMTSFHCKHRHSSVWIQAKIYDQMTQRDVCLFSSFWQAVGQAGQNGQ